MMAGERPGPWWYSGPDEGEDPVRAEPRSSGPPNAETPAVVSGSGTLAGLLGGAQRLVDWAVDSVLTPHSQHGAPQDHPQCLLCQASTLLGDAPAVIDRVVARSRPGGVAGRSDDDRGDADPSGDRGDADAVPIRWLPVRDEP